MCIRDSLKPFAWLAAGLSWAVLKCFGVELKRQEEDVTEEEIMLMVNEGQEKGVLEASEAEMITNIFELDNKQAGDIMTHRTAVKALDGDMTFKEAEQYVVCLLYTSVPAPYGTLCSCHAERCVHAMWNMRMSTSQASP